MMDIEPDAKKIDAIFELREAVEAKVHAEHDLDLAGTGAARDALVTAQMDVEVKTQDALQACHDCGGMHAPEAGHRRPSRINDRRNNVISVDFRPDAERK